MPSLVTIAPEFTEAMSKRIKVYDSSLDHHYMYPICLHFQYLACRNKLKEIGLEDKLEQLNRQALRIARSVANDTGTLMAGNIAHTWIWEMDDVDTQNEIKAMFKV